MKVLHSICQQIWKTQLWPQDWKKSVLVPIPKKVSENKVKSLSRVRFFVTPWTVAHQASLFMRFSRQEYWIGLPFPSPGDLPDPGIEPRFPTLQADALTSEPPGASKVMLKILQARLHQYLNREPPDVQAGFRKGRGTRDQIANIHCIIETAKKNIYFCFIDYAKAFDSVDHKKCGKF